MNLISIYKEYMVNCIKPHPQDDHNGRINSGTSLSCSSVPKLFSTTVLYANSSSVSLKLRSNKKKKMLFLVIGIGMIFDREVGFSIALFYEVLFTYHCKATRHLFILI